MSGEAGKPARMTMAGAKIEDIPFDIPALNEVMASGDCSLTCRDGNGQSIEIIELKAGVSAILPEGCCFIQACSPTDVSMIFRGDDAPPIVGKLIHKV